MAPPNQRPSSEMLAIRPAFRELRGMLKTAGWPMATSYSGGPIIHIRPSRARMRQSETLVSMQEKGIWTRLPPKGRLQPVDVEARSANRPARILSRSQINLLGGHQRVIHLNADVADRALQLTLSKVQLAGKQRSPVFW